MPRCWPICLHPASSRARASEREQPEIVEREEEEKEGGKGNYGCPELLAFLYLE